MRGECHEARRSAGLAIYFVFINGVRENTEREVAHIKGSVHQNTGFVRETFLIQTSSTSSKSV